MNFASLLFNSIGSLMAIFYSDNLAESLKSTFLMENSTLNAHNFFIPSTETIQTFDFIVVGGGSAGSVIASRLAKHDGGKYTVAMLEAGSDPAPQSFVPGFLYQALFYTPGEYSIYAYTSVKQETAAGYNDGTLYLTQGKVLGGSGGVNVMIYNRGSRHDYDNWANHTGDPSWNFENVLPHFLAIENGPMVISNQSYAPGRDTWLEAGGQLDYPVVDPNGPEMVGFSPMQYTKKDGRRESAYTAYIGEKNAIPNLTVLTYAKVTEIIFDESKRATEVVYEQHGVSTIARARREIIVSAGVYGSPHLLMRSGVGPASDLQELGIPVVSDLPVGQFYQDHSFVPLRFNLDDPSLRYDPLVNITEETVTEFLEKGTGPLTTVMGEVGQAFLTSDHPIAEGYPDWPDLQLTVAAQDMSIGFPYLQDDSTKGIFVTVTLTRSKSVGSVKLDKENVKGSPAIDPNFFTDSLNQDKTALLQGIRSTIKIFEEAPAYQNVGARHPKPNLPSCDDHPYDSDDYWLCYIRETSGAGSHGGGTCRMGRTDDATSVVDSKLRVIGVTGLRVADTSVMPTPTCANTHSAALLIGEKVAADIIADL